eukprot:TRINITY_DN9589_c2_g1_i1.p1 TRINITY_DN9589_c2_g1~~TRINITY_DN9589_c2_g1_i1.p1  ORF type:complete len:429 (-),score=98.29 TRINITY_DN9589_c2_g1_i1:36-1322(-)
MVKNKRPIGDIRSEDEVNDEGAEAPPKVHQQTSSSSDNDRNKDDDVRPLDLPTIIQSLLNEEEDWGKRAGIMRKINNEEPSGIDHLGTIDAFLFNQLCNLSSSNIGLMLTFVKKRKEKEKEEDRADDVYDGDGGKTDVHFKMTDGNNDKVDNDIDIEEGDHNHVNNEEEEEVDEEGDDKEQKKNEDDVDDDDEKDSVEGQYQDDDDEEEDEDEDDGEDDDDDDDPYDVAYRYKHDEETRRGAEMRGNNAEYDDYYPKIKEQDLQERRVPDFSILSIQFTTGASAASIDEDCKKFYVEYLVEYFTFLLHILRTRNHLGQTFTSEFFDLIVALSANSGVVGVCEDDSIGVLSREMMAMRASFRRIRQAAGQIYLLAYIAGHEPALRYWPALGLIYMEVVTPFMHVRTYLTRYFATLGPSWLQPPFTGHSI